MLLLAFIRVIKYLDTFAQGGFEVVLPETQTGGGGAILLNLQKKKKNMLDRAHIWETKASSLFCAKSSMQSAKHLK